MVVKKIKFYRENSGDSPVEDFLDSLASKDAQKILWVLKLIEEQSIVPTSFLKKLVNTDDIWEVRATLGSNSYRILGFMWDSEFVVLTNGFSKKTQKVPRKEIKLAERRKKKYIGGIQ